MPICLRGPDEKPEEKNSEPEWREPPGMLGEYVRRVKLLKLPAARRDVREES